MWKTTTLVLVTALAADPLAAQITIKRTIPHVFENVQTASDGLRTRVYDILRREVRLRSEYEDFIRDLTSLGRGAVSDILDLGGRHASDRYVTEALLRLGGHQVRNWLDELLVAKNTHTRQAVLAGIPALVYVDGSVRDQLVRLIHDQSPQVRILAIQKLHTLASVHELLTRCHDIDRNVSRTAILTVAKQWVFLDHGRKELDNLKRFVGLLEGRRSEVDWVVGRGFLLAFEKDRIADTKTGRDLWRRVRKLPWFDSANNKPVPSSLLAKVRKDLRAQSEGRVAFLAKMLKKLPPHAGAELLMVLADEKDQAIRLAACEAGLTLLDAELASGFLRFLKDGDRQVRARAKALFEQTNFYEDQKRRWGAHRRM